MNNQQAFDKAAKHLLTQNKTSIDVDGSCMYRGPDGLQCAVGCLIPAEEYCDSVEGASVKALMRDKRLPPSLQEVDVDLLTDLQKLHDEYPVKKWRTGLAKIADRYKLSGAVLWERIPGTCLVDGEVYEVTCTLSFENAQEKP